ncbi:hypothetical protein X732_19850 [Mesorhizobium sp. L2C066B000]|nr:hypothetical protein X732_19850 [Mesorhizobium sp. L2C066B000]
MNVFWGEALAPYLPLVGRSDRRSGWGCLAQASARSAISPLVGEMSGRTEGMAAGMSGAPKPPISPRVGEMSGRTEGGAKDRYVSANPDLRQSRCYM